MSYNNSTVAAAVAASGVVDLLARVNVMNEEDILHCAEIGNACPGGERQLEERLAALQQQLRFVLECVRL
jgi:hypothetical protein